MDYFMNLELRDRTLDHVSIFWGKMRDEEMKRLIPSTNATVEDALVMFKESLKPDSSSFGKVVYFEEKYIGDIWCYGIDEKNGKMAMLSVVIFQKELWGQGVASAATNEFVREVFKKYQIEKLGAFTYAYNFRSIGLLKKIGFIEMEEFFEDGILSKYFEMRRVGSIE